MSGTLGRDKVWNDQIWGEIDKAVRDEVGRIRVAQKVFPSTIVNNLQPILGNALVPPGSPAVLKTGDDAYQAFVEISIQFVLTQAQVEGEESMRLGSTLARLAASRIAASEDAILFLGKDSYLAGTSSTPPVIKNTGASFTNQTAFPSGFVDLAKSRGPGSPPDSILTLLAKGMADLNKRGQPGPYALFLSPEQYALTYSPPPNTLATQADCIVVLATGGFFAVNSLPDKIGILVSLGGEPVKIILGTDATAAFAFTDQSGNYYFRVFERLQLMVRDTTAFEKLQF
jgi:uncharacterized linocin/CFP29 family protein